MEYQREEFRLHYTICGDGHPMLLLHGFGPDHRLMTGCLEPLLQPRGGWKRIYLDLPGMGKSPGQEWITSSDQMLDVVIDFIDALIPGQRFVLAGESYGGYLARGVLYRKPALVQGLLLICPMIVADPTQRRVPSHLALVRDTAFLASLEATQRQDFESFAVVQTQRTWERIRAEVKVGFDLADAEFMARLKANGYAFSFDVDAVATPFAKPVLIVAGRQDGIVGYRDAWGILENYPRATFAVLDRAGHNLQIE